MAEWKAKLSFDIACHSSNVIPSHVCLTWTRSANIFIVEIIHLRFRDSFILHAFRFL